MDECFMCGDVPTHHAATENKSWCCFCNTDDSCN